MKYRQAAWNAAKAAADGLHVQMKNQHRGRAQQQGHHRRRGVAPPALRPQHDQRQRQQRQHDRGPLRGFQISREHQQLAEKFRGNVLRLQAKEIFDLRGNNEDGNAGGEARGDGIRNVVDQAAGPRHPQQQQDGARHHGAYQQVFQAVGGGNPAHQHHEGASWSPDLHPRAAQGGYQESGHDGGE